MTGVADSSLLIWLGRGADGPEAEDLRMQIELDRIAICEPVMFELLRGARDEDEHEAMTDKLLGVAQVAVTRSTFARARAIQRSLAALPGPRRRSIALPDLLIAAAAIDAELPVLHRDRDYEAIEIGRAHV